PDARPQPDPAALAPLKLTAVFSPTPADAFESSRTTAALPGPVETTSPANTEAPGCRRSPFSRTDPVPITDPSAAVLPGSAAHAVGECRGETKNRGKPKKTTAQ